MTKTDLFHEILVPIDFSPSSLQALRLAGKLAQIHGAQVTLLHVEPLSVVAPPTGMLSEGLWQTLEGVQDAVCASAKESLERWAQEELPKDVPARVRVMTGPPAMSVLELLDKGEVDLVVIGTHGRTGLPRLLMGSVAERITRLSPVPVLVAKEPAVVAA